MPKDPLRSQELLPGSGQDTVFGILRSRRRGVTSRAGARRLPRIPSSPRRPRCKPVRTNGVTMDPNPPLVLLHAFPLHAAMWEPQVSFLQRRPGVGPVLAPDFPGFGRRPPGNPELDAFARSILKEMDDAGIQKAVLVGLSMGGYVAFRIMALAAERVSGLVLADTRAGADGEEGKARRTDQAIRVRGEGLGWLADALIPALLGETTIHRRPGVEAGVRTMIQEANPEGVARALEAMRDRPDSTGILRNIHVPTLVLVGEEDTLTPLEQSEIIRRRIPNAALEVIPSAGHLSNLEEPDAFNRALGAFLG